MEGMQLVKVDYSTSDIITAIQKCDALFRTDTASIAKTLRRRTHRETVRAVFDYLLANVRYKLDESGVQLARRPKRTISEKEGDCKSFSLLAGSLLYNLGYDYSYRFASYRIDPTPTHVYVIAHTPDGDIIVDGVLKKFDQEKKPITNQIDKRMKGLYIGTIGSVRTKPRRRVSTVAINGLDTLPINGVGKIKLGKAFKKVTAKAQTVTKKVATKAKSTVKNVATATKKVAVKAATAAKKVAVKAGTVVKKVAKAAVKVVKKGANLLKKGYLSGPRNAFLLLVKVNFRGFATRLAQSDQAKLRKRWEQLGGSYNALKQVVDNAKNKKRILGIGSTVYVPLSGISAIGEPVTVASAIASAVAVIAALKQFLPKNATEGASPEALQEGEALNEALENGESIPFEDSGVETTSGRSVQLPDEESFQSELVEASATKRGNTSVKRSSANNGNEETASAESGDSGMSNTTKIVLGVAAAGALFLATKKK